MSEVVKALFQRLGVVPFFVVFERGSLTFPFVGAARIVEDEEEANRAAEKGRKVIELIAVDEEARAFHDVLADTRSRASKGVLSWARFVLRWLKNKAAEGNKVIWAGEEAAEVLRMLGFVNVDVTVSPRELLLLLRNRSRRTTRVQ